MSNEQATTYPMLDPKIRKQVEERIHQLEFSEAAIREKNSQAVHNKKMMQANGDSRSCNDFIKRYTNDCLTYGPVQTKTAPTEEDLNARRQTMLEIMNSQLQVHDLAARLALRDGMAETDALPVLERMEAFGRMTLEYTELNEKALKSYREAVESVNKASWEDIIKMAGQATVRRAELQAMIRHFQREGHQEANQQTEQL